MKKQFILLIILIFSNCLVYSTTLSNVKLYSLDNQATQKDTINYSLVWYIATDSNGETVYSAFYSGVPIDLSELKQGLYLVTLHNKNNLYQIKLIKQ